MSETVVILGAGAPDGVGGALARKFAKNGLNVIVSGRTQEKLNATTKEIEADGGSAEGCVADVTSEADLDALFKRVEDRQEPLAAVLFNAGSNLPVPFEDLTPAMFEEFWRIGCYGAFLTAKKAMPILKQQGQGSILFTGASASLRGRPGFGHFAATKAALRNLVQALAREYGPQGIHVAHVVIDGIINGDIVRGRYGEYLESLGEDGSLAPDAIAQAFWTLHKQHRSAWTHELDLRPFSEKW